MNHIFLSYSRKNVNFVSQVSNRLRQQGISVWQDVAGKDSGIPFSTKWFDVIREAIYNSAGVVFFQSESWLNSAVCRDEYKLTTENRIPIFEIQCLANAKLTADDSKTFGELYTEKINRKEVADSAIITPSGLALPSFEKEATDSYVDYIVRAICQWVQSSLDNEVNYTRVDLLSRSWDFVISGRNHRPFPNKQAYRQLRKYGKNVAMLSLDNTIEKAQIEYLKKTRNHRILQRLLAISGAFLTILCVIFLYATFEEFNNIDKLITQMEEKAKQVTINSADYILGNPNSTLAAITKATDEELTIGEYDNYFRILVGLNNMNYPSERITAPEELDALKQKIQNSENDNFLVTSNTSKTTLDITDKTTGEQFYVKIPGVIDGYSISKDNNFVALYSGNNIYLQTICPAGNPLELYGSLANITSIGWLDSKVAAITTDAEALIWENPLTTAPLKRNLYTGMLIPGRDGASLYVVGNKLLLNDKGSETAIKLDSAAVLKENFLAVSRDGKLAAISYTTAANDTNSHIVVIDLQTLEQVGDYSLNCEALGFCFSLDGSNIYFTATGNAHQIGKLEVGNGEISLSNPNTVDFIYVYAYHDGIVASTADLFALYDEDLNPTSELFIAQSGVTPKRMVVKTTYNRLYYAASGGGLSSTYIDLSDKSTHALGSIATFNNDAYSKTAVCLTNDERYYAEAYSNGQTYIYGPEGYLLWGSDIIREPVIDLMFSGDDIQLLALGASGTTYRFTLEPGELVDVSQPSERDTHWQLWLDRVTNKFNALKEGV